MVKYAFNHDFYFVEGLEVLLASLRLDRSRQWRISSTRKDKKIRPEMTKAKNHSYLRESGTTIWNSTQNCGIQKMMVTRTCDSIKGT